MKKIYFLSCLFFIQIYVAKSQWVADTSVRNVICNASGTQYEPRLCVDGHKGAIICWADARSTFFTIYAQHIDSAGYIHLAQNGVIVSDTSIDGSVENPEIVTDSAGGAIICYESINGGGDHIYAVRIDSLGHAVWPAPVAIDVANDSRIPEMVSDQNGGAIISWYSYISAGAEVFVQWIDKNGNVHLPVNGLQITNNSNAHYSSWLAYAGDSTAYITYADGDTLRVMRFDSTGTLRWSNPVTLSNTFGGTEFEYGIRANANGDYNAFEFWSDMRSAAPRLYGQRIKENGTQMWSAGGNAIDTAVPSINFISYTTDNFGGSYVSYGSNPVRVVRVNLAGQKSFTPLQMCSSGGETDAFIRSDGSYGAIVAWQDERGDYGVYAQRVDSFGNLLWRSCGAPVYTANNPGTSNDMHLISCSDGTGIAAFLFSQNDVYAAKVENSTNVGINESNEEDSWKVYPNPSSGNIYIYLNSHTEFPSAIGIYDATGRKLFDEVVMQQMNALNLKLPEGIYFINLTNVKGSLNKKIVIE